MKITWKTILLTFIILILAGVATLFFVMKRELSAPNPEIRTNTLVLIESGESTKSVGDKLKAAHLIGNRALFRSVVFLFAKQIKPGYYEITPNMSMADIISLFDSGKIKLVKVLIPEGWRLEQIGTKLANEGILNYSDFVTAAKSHEGTLFPDTYYMNPRMTADEVITMMTDDYNKRVVLLSVSAEDLVLASIVEREAANDADRALIAGIYKNRIAAGMKLQSDPTVEYGRDTLNLATLSENAAMNYTFWKSAKTAEFTSVKSPFNTYIITALPPTPICNPGLASIEAALNPQVSTYYYFLYGSDGKIYPSHTAAEHQTAVVQHLN